MKYTEIVTRSFVSIADQAVNAQCAICPEELAKLSVLEVAQLLCDAHRALNNTRVASQAISKALRDRPTSQN